MEQISLWANFIGNVGFPIALVFYLLLRLEKSFQKLEHSIEELIAKLIKR